MNMETNTATMDQVDFPESNPETDSTPASSPRPMFVTANQPQPKTSTTPDTLNLDKAQKIIKALTDDPSWLADPRTSHAANAVFGAASKVVSMNLQMEKLMSQAEAAKAKNSMTRQVATSLLKMAESGPEGASIASKWYAQGSDGKQLWEDPSNFSSILADYKIHSAKDIKPKGIEISMPDGSKVQATYNPATGAFHPVTPESERTAKATTAIEQKHIAALETQYTDLDKKFNAAKAKFYSLKGSKNATEEAAAAGAYNALFVERANKADELKAAKSMITTPPILTSPQPSAALPMPSVKTELKTGQRYNTSRGEATWDGEKFVQ